MKVEELNFFLPSELLAREPREMKGENRSDSRLMVMNRKENIIEHKKFDDIIDYLSPGDVLVLNNSKVIKADLLGWYDNGKRRIEMELAGVLQNGNWQVYFGVTDLEKGKKIDFGNGVLTATLVNCIQKHIWEVKFDQPNVIELVDIVGRPIMSPYVNKKYDISYYQNVYAEKPGSAELPSAGRHFSKELLDKIKKKGVEITYVTLHTGLSSVAVEEENFEDHEMYEEQIEVSEETAKIINTARSKGHKIICVGTTVVRTLETVADNDGYLKAFTGYSKLYIYPGYKFKITDKFITNFHGANTSRIAMAAAFTGKELLMRGYNEAIERKYLFYEFGDTTFTI